MKKIFFVSVFLGLLLTTNNSFAQRAGENPTTKPPTQVQEKPITTTTTTVKKGWNSEDRQTFIAECIGTAISIGEDSARFYCYCMQEKIEKKFPNVNDANKLTADDLEKPEWKNAARACLSGIGKWTAEDRADFITECVNAATATLGKEKAKSYCECMLYKVEKKFPDPNEADLDEDTLATPEWQKMIKDCKDF